MRGVSDCLCMVSTSDIQCAEQAMILSGLNENEINKKLYWKKKFLRHCRRTTGYDRDFQLLRFDKFVETFIRIRDAKTNELLIGPKIKLKIDATRLAIASGYYIDPEGVNMFRELRCDR
jgi:hypothetical protein